jgi:hypothetical protein
LIIHHPLREVTLQLQSLLLSCILKHTLLLGNNLLLPHMLVLHLLLANLTPHQDNLHQYHLLQGPLPDSGESTATFSASVRGPQRDSLRLNFRG